MRQKTLISALVLIAFIAAPFPALAADIFIKKNKEPVTQEQPAEPDPAPQQTIPGTAVKVRPAPVVPQSAPAASPQQQSVPRQTPSERATSGALCTPEDLKKISQFEGGIEGMSGEVNPQDKGIEKWVTYLKDPANVKEIIRLYTACAAHLHQQKEASKTGGKPAKSKQTTKPVLRKN